MGRDALLVFLKRPRPGEVKTRLAAALGAEAAADLYRVLAEEALRRTAPSCGDYDRLLFFTPRHAHLEMEDWLPGETWLPQSDGDLGGRMAHAFSESFRRGARRAVIVGSDVPSLSGDVVRAAFRALDDHDLVLGPARDGGYYLVGLARLHAALFHDIPWSAASVLTMTLERACTLGLSVRLLDPLRDVDTLEDIREEWDRLRPLLEPRAALRAIVESALTSREPLGSLRG